MDKIRLEVLGISYSHTQSGAYALVLGEVDGKRRLPIIIGNFEAQSIAIELEKMKPSRPLTHDLFKNFADTFHIEITEVIIYRFVEGIFYSKLICNDGIKTVEIDARTSDAVALAVRYKCPIFTFENILSSAGIILDETQENQDEQEISSTEETEASQPISEFSQYTLEELEEMLTNAIDEEHYERASKIRDEIKNRQKEI